MDPLRVAQEWLAKDIRRFQTRMREEGRFPAKTGDTNPDNEAVVSNKQEALTQASLTVIHVVAAITFLAASAYHSRRMLAAFRGTPLERGF